MVEIMNVKVDIKTIESEKNAQKLETRYKIFMDTCHVEDTVQFCLSKDTLKYDAIENISEF